MQRQLSNVSVYSYQDHQPARRYGPQYEPGGYAAVVQQRTNMTQREDALKFEQGRIKALQEERLHIQKKTFTKWVNSFLQKARMEVEDLFEDLGDGRRLLKLLEIISGERLPRPNSGRMRVHKIENVNKSLSFLHTKVRLESIGAEDIVDGNPRLILGLVWTIILRFQIQEIEIDVDEENETSEKKSAKDALLLWCQRKTSGYRGVHIHNFTDSWRSGLGFNALIHAHRPDLFRWNDVPTATHVDTLNHAFDVAHQNLNIPKLLDAEDIDTTRPDEKSVMTYVASYYHTFARMKQEQKSGRRIANIVGQLMEVDGRKAEYSRLVTELLEWIRRKEVELNERHLPNQLDGIQRLLLAFKEYRTVEKPPKYKERSEIEALYFDINTANKSLVGEAWAPPDGQLPHDLERAWQRLEQAEHSREIALRTELLRQQRLEQLNYKFNTKSVLRKGYLKEMIQVLSDPRYGSNLAHVDATVKKHEAISADILARTERFEDLSAMAAELVREKYHGAEAVTKTEQAVLARWRELLALLEKHRAALAAQAQLTALLREAATIDQALTDMKTLFDSEETGRQLADVERLVQAHALQELQLSAYDDSIRRLLRHADGEHKEQLKQHAQQLQDKYDSLLAAAKDRKARLEDARNLYQFLEDHDEEEAWVSEKMRICRAEVAAKDLRAVLALRQKHSQLLTELRARDHVAARHRAKGQSLIDGGHPRGAEVQRRLDTLQQQWAALRELAEQRERQLADAAEAHQFYGDANEAESLMREQRALVNVADCGRDEPSAAALLARHRATHDALRAYRAELDTLAQHANTLQERGIHTLQLPMEVDGVGEGGSDADGGEEWVSESRLVPTDVWEEQPVERLEHRTVTEERAVPQVKALYPFSGQGISMVKGEVMFLLSKTNPDWWSVRKADRTDGFVPANYVREIEPRTVPVQVRRPEKVRTVQRVKKTVLVKQVVQVKRPKPAARRPSRQTQPVQQVPAVGERMHQLQKEYEELLSLSESRRLQLEEAMKLFALFAECDDLEKWLKDRERLLSDDQNETVDQAKRKYEKFVTDLSAASKRLERIEAGVDELVKAKHGQASRAQARLRQLRQMWDGLLRLKQNKERSLEGASSVELFQRTCDEALEWMGEKQQQLSLSGGGSDAADLRSVRALQRRHAQLERELEPLREKVHAVTMLADDVKSQYPNERASVEGRQREIEAAWKRCEATAADRRARLESAVGHQVFAASSQQLQHWLQTVQEQLATEVQARDVATAETLHQQHQELNDDIKAHDHEFKEVIQLGRQLVGNNPALTDVAERVKQLEQDQKAVKEAWSRKEAELVACVHMQSFIREADRIDAATRAHRACLNTHTLGNSVDEVEALLKRHEELEARLAAQDERLASFAKHTPPADPQMAARRDAVLARREEVKQAAAERRRALLSSLAHQQFMAAAEELSSWLADKARVAADDSYREIANLERKLQQHEAFQRELRANEKQLRDLHALGTSLQQSDPSRAAEVGAKLKALEASWEELGAASRDKASKLRQAQRQRDHKRSVEEARARLAELERALRSEELGSDLRSCKRLLQQHQALEQELIQCEQKAEALSKSGAELVADGLDAAGVKKGSHALLQAVRALREPADARHKALNTSLQVHKFATSVGCELDWLRERRAAAAADTLPADLHAAQVAAKRHAKLSEELANRRPLIDNLLKEGNAHVDDNHPQSDKIKQLCSDLEEAYAEVCSLAKTRGARLDAALRAQQFMQDAGEVEVWLADKEMTLNTPDVGKDKDRATLLLTRHKAIELELDTYAGIVGEMGRAATEMARARHPEGEAMVQRHAQLLDTLQRLQRRAQQRQKALVDSVCRHEYLVESAELESWIAEQHAAAASDDYGRDYEHLLVLMSKFEELRVRVEGGAERFAQCEELAHKLLASDSPHIADIERRQEALGESWQRLVDQMATRGSRLHGAGEIHRYHRDCSELVARADHKRAQLSAAAAPRDLAAAAAALRKHDTDENDLLAIDAQQQVLQEEGARLQKQYPGGNVAAIARQQRALVGAWSALRAAADQRKQTLHHYHQFHQFATQVRDLISWCAEVRGPLSAPVRATSAAAAQAARAEHDALKAELDARDDLFRGTLQAGQTLIAQEHPHSQEIEEKCEALVLEHARVGEAWAARCVALDQLIDLHCFLRDARLLHELCHAQEAALGSEISPTLSVEEVDNLLRKHEAFEKLLATQEEKLSTLNTHGDKLLQQHHVESARIAQELTNINDRRKKLHAMCGRRRTALEAARARAQFTRDAAEARAWVADKLHKLQAQHSQGEAVGLEDKMRRLQKHQAFTAELAAHRARLNELRALANQLRPDQEAELQLKQLEDEWARLEHATQQTGRGLEEAQDILEFNQHLEKIEAWIRDKELMVGAGELGVDYEHCAALLRKLDGLDSDMRVDDSQLRQLDQKAEKLTQQGGAAGADVSARRDACVAKWRALEGALKQYREQLAAALLVHAFNRDVEETRGRLAAKSALFSRAERGRDLADAQELQRKHQATLNEAQAVLDKIHQLEQQGKQLADKHPEHRAHIEKSLGSLRDGWQRLQQLAAKRSNALEDAIAHHKFDDHLNELESWADGAVQRMQPSPPDSAQHAENLLQQHHETRAEIEARVKAMSSLKQEAEAVQPKEKVKKLEHLSATVDKAWHQTKEYLTQAHQLQLFKDQARQTEDWLASKEAFLNNDDLGENLDAVENLIRKHEEFGKLLVSQRGRVNDLQKFAGGMLEAGHYDKDYIEARVKEILKRSDKLDELSRARAAKLEQSRQLQQFLLELAHERDWIDLKMQVANDNAYRELSNLQSKLQKHAAFESELAANKKRVDDVGATGERLIENKHYASQEISQYIEDLEAQWRELQEAAKLRGERLQEAYQARVYLRQLDDFIAWLDDVETQLLSEDHGKDLSTVNALLKRHSRLEQQAASKADTAAALADTARHLADSNHFMAEEILERSDAAVKRYRGLQEPMQIRRDNLEDAAHLHRWLRDADDETKWYKEREIAVAAGEATQARSLADAQAQLKKHLALEAELIARESTTQGVLSRASALVRRGHFASAALESRSQELMATQRAVVDAANKRTQALRERCDLLQLMSEVSEMEAWVGERRGALVSSDVGRDEDSVQALMRRLDAAVREVNAVQPNVAKLEQTANALCERKTPDSENLKKRVEELKAAYEEMKLLAAKREQRLQQSLKYFKWVVECEEAVEWMSEQMGVAASEEYGLDVEHVDALQQHFDHFLQALHGNEGRIEAVCEAGAALLEENTPEADRVKQRVDDIRGLWDDLNELATARQEALAGARQVHSFDRDAEETVAWVAQKEAELAALTAPLVAPTAPQLHAARARLRALTDDIAAIQNKHKQLTEEADRLCGVFPDAAQHVRARQDEVSECVRALASRADTTSRQLARADRLAHYFHQAQELLAWINETLARVTAPELAGDVAGAERLVARHKDLNVEIAAKDDAFIQVYADGERLMKEDEFMSSEISERMSTLRSRRATLGSAWERRDTLYAQHLDALLFLRDAASLEAWIDSRVGMVRDETLGDSVAATEDLLAKHRRLEDTIAAQQDRAKALTRLTLVEKAFKDAQEAEAAERRESAQRQQAERIQQQRQREVQRLAEQRRQEQQPPPATAQLERQSSVESQSIPAELPQTDALRKDALVKRAESMTVVKTPRRTPSFTTRRRTQSFRRHKNAPVDDLPPVEIEGMLERKAETGGGGVRAPVRSWRQYYCVLCGQLLCFFRDKQDFASAKAAAPPLAILNAQCSEASDYRKRAHVFRLRCADGAEFLFACASRAQLSEWVTKLSFHAALAPQHQLTPYPAVPEPDAELRRRLHQNSSSSEEGTPEAPHKPRTQAEILREHRNSQQRQPTPDRNIESSVLPSLPPRQQPQLDNADALLRNTDTSSSWGRSRFSNGRDVNAEFIRSQREAADRDAVAPPALPEKPSVGELVSSYQQRMSADNWQRGDVSTHYYTTNDNAYGAASGNNNSSRPASVAGSGGSPALDPRPASRSSGESELSVSSVTTKDKKDKKGVFGGLFRKKRPHSQLN